MREVNVTHESLQLSDNLTCNFPARAVHAAERAKAQQHCKSLPGAGLILRKERKLVAAYLVQSAKLTRASITASNRSWQTKPKRPARLLSSGGSKIIILA